MSWGLLRVRQVTACPGFIVTGAPAEETSPCAPLVPSAPVGQRPPFHVPQECSAAKLATRTRTTAARAPPVTTVKVGYSPGSGPRHTPVHALTMETNTTDLI